ncbi:hypothetical protein PMIN07_009098 [Paraphaeosphaeria minitans]
MSSDTLGPADQIQSSGSPHPRSQPCHPPPRPPTSPYVLITTLYFSEDNFSHKLGNSGLNSVHSILPAAIVAPKKSIRNSPTFQAGKIVQREIRRPPAYFEIKGTEYPSRTGSMISQMSPTGSLYAMESVVYVGLLDDGRDERERLAGYMGGNM